MPDKRNVEINVRCEKELEPDHNMLDSLIVTGLRRTKTRLCLLGLRRSKFRSTSYQLKPSSEPTAPK